MKITGLHLLLTYRCSLECDHCFVWGSPWQRGTMTLRRIRRVLEQARQLETVESIYFEGGEPFLYYAVLVKGVEDAAQHGFRVGVVTNAYWAASVDDALVWLRPFAGRIQDLSVSSDLYHSREAASREANNARVAAKQLGIPCGIISIAQPEAPDAAAGAGRLPQGESGVMYRGRAAEQLSAKATSVPRERFTTCPYENLRDPGRVHVDPFGNIHICQGVSIGNLFEMPLRDILDGYEPDNHPITGPLLNGGPLELARRHSTASRSGYADACHFCHETRAALRERFPQILRPDQMYGVSNNR